MKSGTGTLTLGGDDTYSGGTELDEGTLVLGNYAALPGSAAGLVVNGGRLNLNGNDISIGALNGTGGVITDDSQGTGTSTTTINVGMYTGSHPALFAGSIQDGDQRQLVSLVLSGEGLLTLTGDNAYTGGTYEEDGWLQIGDGRSGTTNGSIEGPVFIATQNGLTFDVAERTNEAFDGVISPDYHMGFNYGGSVLKTGAGELTMTGDTTYGGSTYPGATRVYQGKLYLEDPTALSAGTQLIVDNDATVNLGGNSTSTLQPVTLNDGSIVSTDGDGTNLPATLTASDSFNFANGSIGASVTLAGTASLNKRTTGTVPLDGPSSNYIYTGNTFVDVPELLDNNGNPIPSTSLTPLYWAPGGILGGTGTWNGLTTNTDWLTSPTGTPTNWQDGDVAVFEGTPGTVTVSGSVSPAGIEFDVGVYDVEDDGTAGSNISVPPNESLVVTVPATVPVTDEPTLGCVITGGGSLTKEGDGLACRHQQPIRTTITAATPGGRLSTRAP